MDILTIFLRTVLIYFVVFLMLRIMGKREIGKLSLFRSCDFDYDCGNCCLRN